ncbi:hypothetical protein LB504_010860 [Fusarium proliferatum]|nr:hypothetical protein LB504_010860 [Fusarium proliferatum]
MIQHSLFTYQRSYREGYGIYKSKEFQRELDLYTQLANFTNRAVKGIAVMDAIPVEQMNIAMLIRLIQMMRSELSQLRAGIVPGLDAGSEAVEEGPETPDTLLHGLEVTYQLPGDEETPDNQQQ